MSSVQRQLAISVSLLVGDDRIYHALFFVLFFPEFNFVYSVPLCEPPTHRSLSLPVRVRVSARAFLCACVRACVRACCVCVR